MGSLFKNSEKPNSDSQYLFMVSQIQIKITDSQFKLQNNSYTYYKFKMEFQNEFTKQETDQYNKICDNCYTVEEKKASELCLTYYIDYKYANNNAISPQKVQLAFKCAYFLAEKSQFIINMKGECIRGISFSVNKLLKDFKLDDTMCMLKQFHKCVKIDDKETSSYLTSVIKELSFLYTLHMKFNKTIEKLEMREREGINNQYINQFKSYAWLLFIESKNKILNKSLQLVENTYMIGYILCWMVTLAWDYTRSQTIMRVLKDRKIGENNQKMINRTIKEKIMEIFCLKDVMEFKRYGQAFEQYFFNNMETIVAKMKSEKDLLSPHHIQDNYRKLDKIYMKSIDPQDLDERVFVKERTSHHTPTKFTPFARQGYLNKLQKPNRLSGNIGNGPKEHNFTSHRILNYEMIQKQIENKNVPNHQIKLPKNILQSPSMVKAPLILATPMTAAMQMVNYLKQKVKRKWNPNSTLTKNFDRKAFDYINRVFLIEHKDHDEKTLNKKKEDIYFLFKIISDDFSSQNIHEKDNKTEFFKCILALSIEIVFFVYNERVEFHQIEHELKTEPFQMWIVLSFFMKNDKSIPTTLRLHLLDLEVDLISYKLWRNPELVEAISCAANINYQKYTDSQISTFQKLFKRLLHQIAFQITRLTPTLSIDQNTSETIFQTMKEILISHSQLLIKRHVDQLIMCGIYVIGKVKDLDLKFNEIQAVYVQINPNLKNIIQEITMRVYINEDNQDGTIISFYNDVFIMKTQLKDFIVSSFADLNNRNINAQKNSQKNTVLMSPLKGIIPKEVMFKGNSYNLNKNKGNITPQTNLLYAYNESPILKYEVNSFRNLKTKKALNFEQQEEKSQQVSEQNKAVIRQNKKYGIGNDVSTPQGNCATNEYIINKFIRNKGPQQKENINFTVTPTNSNRSLFDTNITDKKQTLCHNGYHKNDETWHKGKNHK